MHGPVGDLDTEFDALRAGPSACFMALCFPLAVPFAALLVAASGVRAQTTAAAPATSQAGEAAVEMSHPQPERSNSELGALSLEELMALDVSIVSRKTESWWSAAGAIDVVTAEDIRRAGALSIPEALRLSAGLHVAQLNSREWAISARGFNLVGANKMNVQIDGRNVYTPFFSGVNWDVQDTMLEDIDRIEVLRGPSGALWGAYSVNGFISIITKPAWETQGLLASAAAGTDLPGAVSLRYGGKIGARTYYRTYLKYTDYKWTYLPGGERATSASDIAQAGFRSDTRIDQDTTFTLQGDAYTNKGTPEDNPVTGVSGYNLGGTWKRVLNTGSDLQAYGYYDHTSRAYAGPFFEDRDTSTLNLKYRVTLGRHELQVGADSLVSSDHIESPTFISIDPSRRTFTAVGAFVQDAISFVPDRWVGTVGLKAEYTSFSSTELSPTLRLACTPNPETTVWAALSRAARPPVRVDEDLLLRSGPVVFFQGNKDQLAENVIAAELGFRRKLSETLALDLSAFANSYDDIRSYETSPSPSGLPWTFGNSLNARSTGAEVALLFQPLRQLFIKATYRYLDFVLTKDAGSRDFQNGLFEANDARHLATVIARLNLPAHFELDGVVRYSSDLPRPALSSFVTADARLGWVPDPRWDVSLIARNLFDPRHGEFQAANSSNQELPRSLTAKVTWRY